MAYRFNGSSDLVDFAIGPFSGYAHGPLTFAVFTKRNATGAFRTMLTFLTSPSTLLTRFNADTGDQAQLFRGGLAATGTGVLMTNTSLWYLVVVTAAGGSVAPRFHIHNGTSWSHVVGSASVGNSVAANLLRVGASTGTQFWSGDIVCAGAKKSDTTDLGVEALNWTSFSSWTGFGFDWLVRFDDVATRTNVANPGSGDETTRSGTSLVADPPTWSWATPVADFTGTPLVGTAPLTVAFTNLSTG